MKPASTQLCTQPAHSGISWILLSPLWSRSPTCVGYANKIVWQWGLQIHRNQVNKLQYYNMGSIVICIESQVLSNGSHVAHAIAKVRRSFRILHIYTCMEVFTVLFTENLTHAQTVPVCFSSKGLGMRLWVCIHDPSTYRGRIVYQWNFSAVWC